MRKSLGLLSFWRLPTSKISNFHLVLAAYCSILSITSGHRLEVKNCGVVRNPRSSIVGGNAAQDGAYPWMVSIHLAFERKYEHECGASIINEHWIVTAAHCIDYPTQPQRYSAIVGLHKLSKKNRPLTRTHHISKLIVHEDYDFMSNANDIALMRTVEPIDIVFSRGYVNGICLPDSQEDPEGWAIVTGWGDTYHSEKKRSDDELKAVIVPIIPRKTCSIVYDRYPYENMPDTQICAGDTFKDSCQGDSGGPLVQRDRNGRYTLIGIVSYGFGCGEKDIPGVYTKVSLYLEWMEANMSDK